MVAGTVLCAAAAERLFDSCIGCECYRIGVRLGLVSVCLFKQREQVPVGCQALSSVNRFVATCVGISSDHAR